MQLNTSFSSFLSSGKFQIKGICDDSTVSNNIIVHVSTGLDFRKKRWGQLAPKFLDLVASTNFLVAGCRLQVEI